LRIHHCFLDPDARPHFAKYAERLADMGTSGIRLSVYWPEVEPESGRFAWDVPDDAIDAITSQGMSVYLNLVDIPAHAAGGWEGYRTWFPRTAKNVWPRCWDPSGNYDPSISAECAAPPHIDGDALRRTAAELAKHYGSRVRYWGMGNEPDLPVFFPPAISADWGASARRAAFEQSKPFAEGIRSVIPDATLMGPETSTAGSLNAMLRAEREANAPWYDIISFHLYAQGGHFPEDALARIDGAGEYLAYLRDGDVRAGRPLAIGETGVEHGEDPVLVLKFLRELRARDVFDIVTLLMPRAFFREGTFEAGTFEPNQLFRDVERLITRAASSARRRAAVA